MKNSGVRCHGRFEKASIFLIGGPDPHPLQAHRSPGRDAARLWASAASFRGPFPDPAGWAYVRRDKHICQPELHAAHKSAVPISAMMAHQGRSRCGVLDFLLDQQAYVCWKC